MRSAIHAVVLLVALLLVGAPAQADTTTTSDKAAFMLATGAVSATGTLPQVGKVSSPYQVGDVTYRQASGDLYFGYSTSTQWTDLIEGSELAISDEEDVDLILDEPATAIGFDFAEHQASTAMFNGCNWARGCVDSTFTVTLRFDGQEVGSTTFNAANDEPAFVGITNDVPFDVVEIRETTGGTDNEYFGQIYTALDTDTDTDNDGVDDDGDNCPSVGNADQDDQDEDGTGDACDADIDGDGVDNADDTLPLDPNAGAVELSADGLGALVDELVTDADVADGLNDKLDAIESSLERGNTTAAAGQLGAFLNQLEAQEGNTISTAEADTLRTLLAMWTA